MAKAFNSIKQGLTEATAHARGQLAGMEVYGPVVSPEGGAVKVAYFEAADTLVVRLSEKPVVREVPLPVPPSGRRFKYRLVYVVDGVRVVGYDNERGKGDHKHLAGDESAYRFVDVETLVADFMADVGRAR